MSLSLLSFSALTWPLSPTKGRGACVRTCHIPGRAWCQGTGTSMCVAFRGAIGAAQHTCRVSWVRCANSKRVDTASAVQVTDTFSSDLQSREWDACEHSRPKGHGHGGEVKWESNPRMLTAAIGRAPSWASVAHLIQCTTETELNGVHISAALRRVTELHQGRQSRSR